ncbi:MAG: hypothetical protein KatS3mg113_0233 [Planctomycetaceae bacterium]|nr:MAG: hypothetical protein KatS3mg113_0233 [Planctomycetaceae bacterium]
MPIYLYEEILPDGSGGQVYELMQSIHEPALCYHPESGVPIRRKLTAPAWVPKGFGQHNKKDQLSDRNLEKLGFTKYVKNKGRYEKVAGEGPDYIRK